MGKEVKRYDVRRSGLHADGELSSSRGVDKVVLASDYDALLAERDALRDALEDLLGCPANIVQATVPKAGIEAAPPYQVVLDVSVCLTRWNKAKAALQGEQP